MTLFVVGSGGVGQVSSIQSPAALSAAAFESSPEPLLAPDPTRQLADQLQVVVWLVLDVPPLGQFELIQLVAAVWAALSVAWPDPSLLVVLLVQLADQDQVV